MVACVLAPDLVHQHMAPGLGGPADHAHATVDARQLTRGVSRLLDVEPQQADVAAVLRISVVDLRALPEPRLALGCDRPGAHAEDDGRCQPREAGPPAGIRA